MKCIVFAATLGLICAGSSITSAQKVGSVTFVMGDPAIPVEHYFKVTGDTVFAVAPADSADAYEGSSDIAFSVSGKNTFCYWNWERIRGKLKLICFTDQKTTITMRPLSRKLNP